MKLSIVVPVFNEEDNLAPLHERLSRVASSCSDEHEIIFVDDGSQDGSLAIMQSLTEQDTNVRYVSLSRNFGHEMATTAGLDHTDGDAVVIIDADLQDPPEVIADLVKRWRDGVEVVYAQRRRREGESFFKKFTSFAFYRVIRALSEVNIPTDTGDFRLMDRRVVEALRKCRENPRFVRGLVSWIGFRQEAVQYDRAERHAGETKYNVAKLVRLSWEAICAFSLVPLRVAGWLGAIVMLLSFALTAHVAYHKLFLGLPIQGYALLACGLFFLGGIQLLVLGVLSQYVGHIFKHTQQRPLYIIDRAEGWSRVREQAAKLAAQTGPSRPAAHTSPLQPVGS
ncbi:MAG: glycosyltransferase family 2 protein [Phycisphaerales bacterium]|nr:glycosyltransferase family 2 protein [Phycisphaerales bacterium]